ncbi:MAG TPA: VOC family protein [Candidatus Limnocylindrales bacterium]|nr:VOC family protein [Candidatus Limnocylindrales bacterium]
MLRDRRVHPTLPTHDVDALRSFYEEVLGFEPLAVRPGAVMYGAAGGTRFVISRSGASSAGTHTQMAFDVPDLEAEVRDLRSRGVVFEAYEMPRTVDGIAAMPAGRAAWFKDPHGNLIGLIEFAEPVSDPEGIADPPMSGQPIHTGRILVLGDARERRALAERLERVTDRPVDECDPVIGDCVLFTSEASARYAAYVFVGFDDPVTRGAITGCADRAVLVPALDLARAAPDPLVDGYLFRVPRGLGFRDTGEHAALVDRVPKAAAVTAVILGRLLDDPRGLASLLDLALRPGLEATRPGRAAARRARSPRRSSDPPP